MTTKRIFFNTDQSDHISISDNGLYENPQNSNKQSRKSRSNSLSEKQIQPESPGKNPTPHSINIKEYNYNNKIYNVNINSSNSEIIEKIHRQDFSFIDNICNTIEEQEKNLNESNDYYSDRNEDIQFKVYKSTSNKADKYETNKENDDFIEQTNQNEDLNQKVDKVDPNNSGNHSIKRDIQISHNSKKHTRNILRKTKTSEELKISNNLITINQDSPPKLPGSRTKIYTHRRAFLPSNSFFDRKFSVSSSDTSNNIDKSYHTYNSKLASKSSRSVSEVEDEKASIRLMHRKRRASVHRMIVKFASKYEEKNYAFLNDLFEFRARTEDENKSKFLFHKAKFAEGLTAFFTIFSNCSLH